MFFVHPQIQFKDIIKAKLSLVKPVDQKKLNERLTSYFPQKQFIFTDMGREAFKAAIEQLKLQGCEMLMPAYICDIFYPILKSYNIKPVFLDIDLGTFHIKTEEIREKITPQTRAILVCHTYGLPFDVGKVKEYGLIVIEDCAHAFFAKSSGA